MKGFDCSVPWLWPHPRTQPLEYAQRLRECPTGPPPTRPGEVLLVAVLEGAASLWALGGAGAGIELGSSALEAWENARLAFLRAADLLWQRPSRTLSKAPRARKVAVYLEGGASEAREPRVGGLDGASFGLAFLLAQASRVWGIPVGADLAAVGGVSGDGKVFEVASVPLKVRALLERAPAVSRLLVAPGDAMEAREACDGKHLEVLPVATAQEALRVTFGDGLRRRLLDVAQANRQVLCDDLFELGLFGEDNPLNWVAVAKACEEVLAEVRGLSPAEVFRLRFTMAVARRHRENRGDFPPLDEKVLSDLALPVRLRLLAHLVQHCADSGSPALEEVEPFVRPFLVARERFVEHWRLLGAYVRLLWVTGRPREALDLALEVVKGLSANLAWAEIGRPLSACLRLSGALQDQAAFQRAQALLRGFEARGVLGTTDLAFAHLAEAAGEVQCGAADGETLSRLQGLVDCTLAPSHVRYGAWRFLVLAHRLAGGGACGHGPPAPPDLDRDDEERLYRALSRLDEDPEDPKALDTLHDLDPGVVGHLLQAASRLGERQGAYVARFYPY